LEDVVELTNPGSGAALGASIRGAYEKGEAWLGYHWVPTQIAAELDLTVLEELDYSDACWELDKGCAYPTSTVHIAVHPSLISRAPEIIEFLRNWGFESGEFVATETWIAANDATFEEAAIWHLTNNEASWTPMVPADIAANVKAALAAE
jgi:glycine betaine/proline transport system substrate-binding protein